MFAEGSKNVGWAPPKAEAFGYHDNPDYSSRPQASVPKGSKFKVQGSKFKVWSGSLLPEATFHSFG
jgi:hypothetical protein